MICKGMTKEELKATRLRLGMTQAQMAELMLCSPMVVGNYELGKRTIQQWRVDRLKAELEKLK